MAREATQAAGARGRPLPPPLRPGRRRGVRHRGSRGRLHDAALEQVEVGGVPLAAILMPLVDHDSSALEQRQEGHLRRRRRGAGAGRRLRVRPLFHYHHRRHGTARARNGKAEQERHNRSARQQKNNSNAIKELHSNSMVLSEFKDDEELRLLPRCSHVFHPDCIGEWLAGHVTCPICRCNLDPQELAAAEANSSGEVATAGKDQQADQVAIDGAKEERRREEAMELERIGSQRRAVRWSGRPPLLPPALVPRSHSPGHSLATRLDGDLERFTLRLLKHVRREMVVAGEESLRRTGPAVRDRDGRAGAARSARLRPGRPCDPTPGAHPARSGLLRGPEGAAMDCCLGWPRPPPCAPTPTSFGDECAGVPLAATRAAVALARLLRSPRHRSCPAQVADGRSSEES